MKKYKRMLVAAGLLAGDTPVKVQVWRGDDPNQQGPKV